ncbi:MAG: V-type ATPase subunit [Candidatus Jordarchaeum sp.]|uniref:V-type ATPase subunit n=1 Tax=Candidatus Jordarchaeum sp. TaxID=2823881 RepID=UPI004049589F
MSFLSSGHYASINAKVRALKSRMLTIGDYEKLVQAADIDEAVRLLNATSYGEVLARADLRFPLDTIEVDRVLSEELNKTLDLVVSSSPYNVRSYLKPYQKKLYYDNLILVINAVHFKTPAQTVLQYLIPLSPKEMDEYKNLLNMQTVYQVIDLVKEPQTKQILQDTIPEYESIKSPIVFEAALERSVYKTLWNKIVTLNATDRRYAQKLIGTKIDLMNILIIMRAKTQRLQPQTIENLILPTFYRAENSIIDSIAARDIEEVLNILLVSEYKYLAHMAKEAYGENKSTSAIEHAFEEYSTQLAYTLMVGDPFHIGVPIAFLDLKKNEIRNIKIILFGKVEKVEPRVIRDLLIIF